MSRRLVDALENAEVIAAEDTRTAIQLMRALGIQNRPRLEALHEHNELAKAAEIVELARNTDVLVLTDAGMPTVSDPGFVLVAAAVAAGVPVTALPGPSAVLMALAVSGLPSWLTGSVTSGTATTVGVPVTFSVNANASVVGLVPWIH